MTMGDLVKALDWSAVRIRRQIHKLNDAGRLEVVRVWRPRIDSILTLRPAYKLKARAEGANERVEAPS
jgi:hypothetical protein